MNLKNAPMNNHITKTKTPNMKYENIKRLKRTVEDVLSDNPKTRNSDISLTIEIWKRYCSAQLTYIGGEPYVALGELYGLPREDNIKRIRAALNAKGLYWPTDWKVAKARGINEDRWRIALGYPPKTFEKGKLI